MNSFNWTVKSKQEWNDRADFWNSRSKSMWDSGSRRDIIPFLTSHLHSQAKVLDVGCGDGYGTYKLHALGYDPVGVDISEEMIAYAKKRGTTIPFYVADASNLPVEIESVDAILSINVLEWVEVPAIALQELKRVLRKGGLLCVGILGPTAGPRATGFRKVYGEKTISNSMMPWEFQKLAIEMGFELEDELAVYKEGVTERHYEGLSTPLKQAISFMWVFLLRKK
ncbi:class I SAM-dependent methyltransferase [Ornithinibacillus sp. BX22]|uniref:Class I SAM-dependent methyltransferase n=1 Tax=Ornithinibacillus hominis TaxID=2763055 RepID=A0A923L5Q2_9BACI|nr:class I SAM-dependent methyltransferase [Ornithinibacillus hominis]MBC5636939.1 class I SAM-dependent methyltransferase [Ornithinibacillus hominis]